MDDTLKRHILGLALAGAERNRLVFREERELVAGDPAACIGLYRVVKRPVREIEHELQPPPIDAPTLILCQSHPIPIGAIENIQPKAKRPPVVTLDMGTFADGPGPHYHVWLGQCRECRTIWWRIQEA